MNKETTVSLTVDRNGIIDLLVRTKQAFDLAAQFMRNSEQIIDSIVAQATSAYLEVLASAIEQNLDEELVQQLKPLVRSLAAASGDEDLEESEKTLDQQIHQFIDIIKQIKGQDPDDMILMVAGPDEIM